MSPFAASVGGASTACWALLARDLRGFLRSRSQLYSSVLLPLMLLAILGTRPEIAGSTDAGGRVSTHRLVDPKLESAQVALYLSIRREFDAETLKAALAGT